MRTLHVFSDGQMVVTQNASVMLKGQEVATYPLDHLSAEEFAYLLAHWEERELRVNAESCAVLICGELSIPFEAV